MTRLGNIVLILILVIVAGAVYFSYRGVTSPESLPIAEGKCYVGGCSSQICSDQPDVMSTCEFKEEYACYKSATCERQSNGQCGWTETPALKACLLNPPAI